MDSEVQQLLHERELRALRSEYADDTLIRAALALDLAIRRAAWRAVGRHDSRSEGSSMSRSTPGSSTS
jgi:hypothetical protein